MKTHFTIRFLLTMFLCHALNVVCHAQLLEKFYQGRFIISPGDTIGLLKYPEIGKTYHFQGEKKRLKMNVSIKKISDSTISYQLNIIYPNGKKIKENGIAYIIKHFYLGSEQREQLSTGEMFGCTPYFPKYKKDNYMEICIGQMMDGDLPPNKDPLLVQIERSFSGEPKIYLDNTPELIQIK